MSSWRRVTCCALVVLVAGAADAAAQAGLATLSFSITLPDGAVAVGARIEVTPSGAGAIRTAVVDAAHPIAVLPLASGPHRIRVALAGYRVAEEMQDLARGSERRLAVRLAPEDSMGRSTISIESRSEPTYQTNLGAEGLTDLPSGRTVWSLLDTAHPFVISDRMDNGGLWSARAARLGGSGPSWNQTQFRLDGLDVTDMRDGGAPAIYPDLALFQGVQVETARLGVDTAGPGLAISLIPKRPADVWSGTGEAFVTPGSWQPDLDPRISWPLGRYDHWTDASLSAGGPVTGRTGLFASIRATNGGRFEERDLPHELSNNIASLYGHLVGTAGTDRELRITTALSRATRPFEGRARYANRDIDERGRMVLGQASVEQVRSGQLLAVSGGFHRVSNEPEVIDHSQAGNIERLLDGPPLAFGDNANTISQRWTLAASLAPAPGTWLREPHQLRVGASVSGARVTNTPIYQPIFGELVNGVPARAWDIRYKGALSQWTSTAFAAFVSDRWEVAPRMTVDAGLRLDHDSGSAVESDNGIGWTTTLPRFSLRWVPREKSPLTVTAGYSWYRNRLPLDYLSVGDQNGPSGTVWRWDDRNADLFFAPSELTPIAYVGSCCAGSAMNVIDPDLKAPYTAEFLIGAEHRMGAWRMRMTGVDRRERRLVALVDTVPLSQYVTVDVADSGIDVDGNSTAQMLRLYGRTPAMFGVDRYTLTNPDGLSSVYQGVDITVDRELFRRWFFRFGGSAYRIESTGANRGFLSNENDHGLLGEAFLSPNALTAAEGRSFFDRAFVIKMSGAYRAPGDVRIGMVARYQDGLPFSRMVITDAFFQGRDLVMAIPRGAQRFTYMFTLDAKVEKDLTFGRRQVGVILEAYNLTNATIEAEEDVVSGPDFRRVSAVQPPRAVRVGVRVGF